MFKDERLADLCYLWNDASNSTVVVPLFSCPWQPSKNLPAESKAYNPLQAEPFQSHSTAFEPPALASANSYSLAPQPPELAISGSLLQETLAEECQYQTWDLNHWQKVVNGFTGRLVDHLNWISREVRKTGCLVIQSVGRLVNPWCPSPFNFIPRYYKHQQRSLQSSILECTHVWNLGALLVALLVVVIIGMSVGVVLTKIIASWQNPPILWAVTLITSQLDPSTPYPLNPMYCWSQPGLFLRALKQLVQKMWQQLEGKNQRQTKSPNRYTARMASQSISHSLSRDQLE